MEVSLIQMGANEKGWADAHTLIGKKLDVDSDKLNLITIAKGNLRGGKWALVDIKATYNKATDYSIDRIDTLFRKIQIRNLSFVLLAVDNNNIVQVAATMRKFSPISKVKSFSINHLVSKNGSSIPAHVMYAAAVRAGITLLTDSQSVGGMKVWKKLSASPGVTVYGWDRKTKTPVNLGDKFDDESETHGILAGTVGDGGELYMTRYDANASPKDKALARAELAHIKSIETHLMLVATRS